VHEKAEAMAEDNAVTFDLGTILNGFFGVSSSAVPYFMVIFAAGNFLGPLLLGRFFDTVGRIPMISGTYLVSAALVVVLGLMLRSGSLTRWSFEALLVGTFVFASAGASSAYCMVSEIFPMETRALAIALFYAVGTAVGGISGPLRFGQFIHSGSADQVATGFFIGAAAMALGGVAELLWDVRAEGQSLENIAKPLTAAEAEAELGAGPGAPAPAGEAPLVPGLEALASREDAEKQRAVAADHRSELHLLRVRADHDDDEAAEQLEEIVIQIAEWRADGLEEHATALDERATAARATTEADRREALERAEADDERARDYEQRVAVLAAEPGAAAEPAPPHPGSGSRPRSTVSAPKTCEPSRSPPRARSAAPPSSRRRRRGSAASGSAGARQTAARASAGACAASARDPGSRSSRPGCWAPRGPRAATARCRTSTSTVRSTSSAARSTSAAPSPATSSPGSSAGASGDRAAFAPRSVRPWARAAPNACRARPTARTQAQPDRVAGGRVTPKRTPPAVGRRAQELIHGHGHPGATAASRAG
jgi:hypothetical protein